MTLENRERLAKAKGARENPKVEEKPKVKPKRTGFGRKKNAGGC